MRKLILILAVIGSIFLVKPAYSQEVDAGIAATSVSSEVSAPVPTVTPDVEKDPVDFVSKLYSAAKSKDYRLLTVLSVVLVVFLLRWGGKKYVPWFNTDRGGAALALAIGVLQQVILVAGAAGVAFSAWTIVEGLINGITAAGGVTVIKRLLDPKDAVV